MFLNFLLHRISLFTFHLKKPNLLKYFHFFKFFKIAAQSFFKNYLTIIDYL